MGRKIHEFKVKVFSLPHLPLLLFKRCRNNIICLQNAFVWWLCAPPHHTIIDNMCLTILLVYLCCDDKHALYAN